MVSPPVKPDLLQSFCLKTVLYSSCPKKRGQNRLKPLSLCTVIMEIRVSMPLEFSACNGRRTMNLQAPYVAQLDWCSRCPNRGYIVGSVAQLPRAGDKDFFKSQFKSGIATLQRSTKRLPCLGCPLLWEGRQNFTILR